MTLPPADDGERQREIEESDAALVSSQTETAAARAETAASRVETAASRVETQAARVETQTAQAESKVDSATVQGMIEEFATQAENIAKGNSALQADLIESLLGETLVFKRRNRVLVVLAGTIASACIVLVAGMGFLLWRSIFQTGPLIEKTNAAITATIAEKDETIAEMEHVQTQAVYWITYFIQDAHARGETPPEILLGPQYPIPGG